MKNTSKAVVTGALLGALFLGGCAADASEAKPAATETAAPSATTTTEAAPAAPRAAVPEPRGLESSPVIVDPSMDALPGAAEAVQAALANFVETSRSFKDLQVGSRPIAAGDADILAPAMQPLMSEKAWSDSAEQIRSGYLPNWYPSGNPAAMFTIENPEHGKRLIPDENGYTFVHAATKPMTVTAAQVPYPGTYVAVNDLTYRTYFTNTLGEVAILQMEMDYVFTPGADGAWDMWQWTGKPQYFVAETQAQLDAMPEI